MLDGGVQRKLWRKNYQEAKSRLKITRGLEQSPCEHSGKVLCLLDSSEPRGHEMKLGHGGGSAGQEAPSGGVILSQEWKVGKPDGTGSRAGREKMKTKGKIRWDQNAVS